MCKHVRPAHADNPPAFKTGIPKEIQLLHTPEIRDLTTHDGIPQVSHVIVQWILTHGFIMMSRVQTPWRDWNDSTDLDLINQFNLLDHPSSTIWNL